MQRGGENKCLESQADGEVVDPARGTAGFHDDEIDLVVFEDSGEIVAVGCKVEENVFSGFGIEKAAHGIELAEVQSENFHDRFVLWVWGWKNVTVDASRNP